MIAGEGNAIVQVPKFRVGICKGGIEDPFVYFVLLSQINPCVFLKDFKEGARGVFGIGNHANDIKCLHSSDQASDISVDTFEVLVVYKLQLPVDPRFLCFQNEPSNRVEAMVTDGEVAIWDEARA